MPAPVTGPCRTAVKSTWVKFSRSDARGGDCGCGPPPGSQSGRWAVLHATPEVEGLEALRRRVGPTRAPWGVRGEPCERSTRASAGLVEQAAEGGVVNTGYRRSRKRIANGRCSTAATGGMAPDSWTRECPAAPVWCEFESPLPHHETAGQAAIRRCRTSGIKVEVRPLGTRRGPGRVRACPG
jgi:hypothetical protein